jgi:hypothetical protein
VRNGCELKQIVIDFTGDFDILLALHRTFHVAARRSYHGKYFHNPA